MSITTYVSRWNTKVTPLQLILPFSLSLFIIVLDQGVKTYIAENWPILHSGGYVFISDVFDNGLLQIWHVRNKAIAFSIGQNLPDTFRLILFIIVPLLVLAFLVLFYIRSFELSKLQRWALAGTIGGGAGNILDRIFRPDGVVDFISVDIRFLRIAGYERWPTFNIADTCVVLSCLLFVFALFIQHTTQKKSRTERE
ncbi:signal peptidase II [Breznakiellaceae bacterium SP9]